MKEYRIRYNWMIGRDSESGIKVTNDYKEAKQIFYSIVQGYEHDDSLSGYVIDNEISKPNVYHSYNPDNQSDGANVWIEEYDV